MKVIKSLKKIKIPIPELRQFLLTLIATLIGVFIAIALTNMGVDKKEKHDTIKLLNTTKIILENTKSYSKGLNQFILELERDTTQTDSLRIKKIKNNNPIPYPSLIETVITNETLSKNLSTYTHSEIYNHLLNLKKLANYNTIVNYEKSLTEFIYLLELEIKYQKGNLDIEALETEIKLKAADLEKQHSDENILKLETD